MGTEATVATIFKPLLRSALGPKPTVRFVFWDGSTLGPLDGYRGTIRVRSKDALGHMSTTLYDVMRPLDQVHTVTPSTPLMEALETMGRDDVNQLPVVTGNHLDGIVTRANVLQFLQTRAELSR